MVRKLKVKRKTKKEESIKEFEKEQLEEEKSKEEDSELEEFLDRDSVDLQHLIQSFNRAPILGQIDSAPQITNLEQWAVEQPVQGQGNANGESDQFQYSSGNKQDDETKYVSVQKDPFSTEERNVDFSKIGRDQDRHFKQSGFFTSSRDFLEANSNIEKYDVPENVDMNTLGRDSPSEIKMKKYDPKLPSY